MSAVSSWRQKVGQLGGGILDDDETPVCAIFATQAFQDWLTTGLPCVQPQPDEELDPVEEFEFLLAELMRGRTHCWFQRLMPQKKGVWEAKLQHTRVFGWFVQRRVLLLSRGVGIGDIKRPGPPTYRQFISDVQSERQALGTGYIGGDIRNVF